MKCHLATTFQTGQIFGIVENLYGDRKTIKKNSAKALK